MTAANQAKFTFEVDGVGDSTKAWDTENPNGKGKVNGDYLEATVTFTGLPKNNSDFGKKKAKVMYEGNVIAEQAYEVFYRSTATNHPPTSDPYDITSIAYPAQTNTPNIFFYSVQVLKPGNANNQSIFYFFESNSTQACVVPKYSQTFGWTYYVALGGGQFGIDPIGAIAHENQHIINHFDISWGSQKFIDQSDDENNNSWKDSWEIQQFEALKTHDEIYAEWDEPSAQQAGQNLNKSIREGQSWHVNGPNYSIQHEH